MVTRFLFCNDSMYCILNILIGKWCTIAIIEICYGPEQFRILFISWGYHVRSFAHCVKIVQEVLSTFEYDKQPGSLTTGSSVTKDFSYSASFFEYFPLFTILWMHSDSLSSVELSPKMVIFDFSLSVEETRDKVVSTRKYFDLLSSIEQLYEIGIFFNQSFPFLHGKCAS